MGFDIQVKYFLSAVVVEIGQSLGDVKDDLPAGLPTKSKVSISMEDPLIQGSIAHVLVD